MTTALFIVGILIGSIAVLVSLIFGIISLANGKNNNALMWGGGFIIGGVIVVFSIIGMVTHLRDSVVELAEKINQNAINNSNDYNIDDEYQKSQRQEWLDTLQLHINEKYDGNVPADFYINKKAVIASDQSLVLPFLYPYQIKYNRLTYTGDIILPTSDSIFVKNVSEMAFDSNFVLIKIDNRDSPELLKQGHPETEYVLFDLRTRNFEPAPNKAKLDDFANRIGYTGSTELSNLADDYKGWLE